MATLNSKTIGNNATKKQEIVLVQKQEVKYSQGKR